MKLYRNELIVLIQALGTSLQRRFVPCNPVKGQEIAINQPVKQCNSSSNDWIARGKSPLCNDDAVSLGLRHEIICCFCFDTTLMTMFGRSVTKNKDNINEATHEYFQ